MTQATVLQVHGLVQSRCQQTLGEFIQISERSSVKCPFLELQP